MPNILKVRAVISLLLVAVFTLVVATGIVLHFAPTGKIAKQTSWNFLGLDKFAIEKIHTISGFVVAALALIHFSINYKMLSNEVKSFFKKS